VKKRHPTYAQGYGGQAGNRKQKKAEGTKAQSNFKIKLLKAER